LFEEGCDELSEEARALEDYWEELRSAREAFEAD